MEASPYAQINLNDPAVQAAIDARIAAAGLATLSALSALSAQLPQFVGGGPAITMTCEALYASFPPSAALVAKLARVNNYGGTYDRTLRCGFDSLSGLYFWEPNGVSQSTRQFDMSANQTLDGLTSGDVVELIGTVPTLTTRTATLSLVRARPGDMKVVKNSLSSLLGNLNILGTGLGAGIASLLGATSTFECKWNGTGLEWVRLT